jgi:hypothetical protein
MTPISITCFGDEECHELRVLDERLPSGFESELCGIELGFGGFTLSATSCFLGHLIQDCPRNNIDNTEDNKVYKYPRLSFPCPNVATNHRNEAP